VYKWEGGPALVQTVDFFTPIVDDPYTYGRIAAANALSDVYAMGGTPLTALAIAGFPKDALDRETISAIFRGGYDALCEAGVALLGGHTVQDPEVKFGYAVTGAIDPLRVLTNAGARAGDALLLTKPLGTGIVATALKFERGTPDVLEAAVRSMRTLNRAAAQTLLQQPRADVHACTDVTGFGLAGHATEMAAASGVTICMEASRLPLLPGVLLLARANRSGGLGSNQQHFGKGIRISPDVSDELTALLYDPQTSGGLLVAVASDAAERIRSALVAAGADAALIGSVHAAEADVRVDVKP
jgi:selenide,water dikinase